MLSLRLTLICSKNRTKQRSPSLIPQSSTDVTGAHQVPSPAAGEYVQPLWGALPIPCTAWHGWHPAAVHEAFLSPNPSLLRADKVLHSPQHISLGNGVNNTGAGISGCTVRIPAFWVLESVASVSHFLWNPKMLSWALRSEVWGGGGGGRSAQEKLQWLWGLAEPGETAAVPEIGNRGWAVQSRAVRGRRGAWHCVIINKSWRWR